MNKTRLAIFSFISLFIGTAYSYVDCTSPYDTHYYQNQLRQQHQDQMDRLPHKQEIHPDGRGGYYYHY